MGSIIPYDPKLKQRASYLRNHSTRAEIMLWNELKAKKMLGYDFNRQRPILNYIYDLIRQNNIEDLGITVFRFSEKEVRKDI